jgi:DNA repair exonuclease SbcCD nuclease subunit
VSEFRFIHAADVHLDSPLRGLDRYPGAPVDRLRVATREAFANLIDLALEETVDLIVLAGDLYDGDQDDYNTALFLTAQLRRLGEIPVVILQGNHDAASIITRSLRMPTNVRLLAADKPQTLRFEELDLAVHGQSFAEKKITRDLTRHYPEPEAGLFNLGVLHTALEGAEGHATYAPCKLADLVAKGYDYWALGHVHQRSVRHEDPWVVYSGNTQGRHVKESEAKGAYLVTVRDRRVADIEFRKLDVLRWARVVVDLEGADEAEDWRRVEEAFAATASQADGLLLAARLELRGETKHHGALHNDREAALAEARSAADATGYEIWLEKIRIATSAPRERDDLFAREDELGALLRSLRGEGAEDDPETGPIEEPPEVAALLRSIARPDRRRMQDDDDDDHEIIEAEARALILERILRREGEA